MEAKKIEFGFFDFSGRVETVHVAQEPGSERYQLSIQLTDTGAKMFSRMTADHVGEFMPIAVDGKVITSPIIRERIASGQVALNGDFTEDAATDLALRIAPACPSI